MAFSRYTVKCDIGHPSIAQSCSSLADARRVKDQHDKLRHNGQDTATIQDNG